MRSALAKLFGAAMVWLCALVGSPALAQQFNSDNYLSKPHGVATLIVTGGQQSKTWITTVSLFPNWELTAAAYLFNGDEDRTTGEGYSTSFYAKWMLHENKEKTGGFAVKFGGGMKPSYVLDGAGFSTASKTLWTNAPVTLPFLDNKLSWDIMPGASVTREYGESEQTVGAFTYATRLAWYPFNPQMAIAGEVYGAEGGSEAIPEYRIGLRWEPSQYAVFALTYDDEFNGTKGAGIEFGVMLFTPPFARLGGGD
jgi:hypothetical protein